MSKQHAALAAAVVASDDPIVRYKARRSTRWRSSEQPVAGSRLTRHFSRAGDGNRTRATSLGNRPSRTSANDDELLRPVTAFDRTSTNGGEQRRPRTCRGLGVRTTVRRWCFVERDADCRSRRSGRGACVALADLDFDVVAEQMEQGHQLAQRLGRVGGIEQPVELRG